jgi:type I restriction enzyme S subunit
VKLPAYPQYRQSGINWLGDVPKHWTVKRARFCMRVNPSSDRLRQLKLDDEVSFVPMEAVGEYGGLNLDVVKPLDEIGGSYTEFQDGDIVVAKITPCFENGKGALAEGLMNGAALGTTELHVLRAANDLDRRFLFYLTISSTYRKTGEAEMYGAGGQKRVPSDFNKDFRTPLPPRDEQRAIADFLDRETARLDTLMGKRRELIEKLKEKRTALISRTVTRGLDSSAKLKPSGIEWLGDIPEHWEVRRIATVADKITNGFVGPTRDILVDEGVRYLQSLHIKKNKILFERQYFVEPEWSREHHKSVLNAGDVLIVQTGDIGQVACVPKEFEGCNCHALIIVGPTRGKLHGPFLSWFLLSSFGFDELKRIQTGALHPHLNCTFVRDVCFPYPPISEQQLIAGYLDRETAKIDKMIEKVEAAIEKLQEYRTALITAAVTGKIDVRNAGKQLRMS